MKRMCKIRCSILDCVSESVAFELREMGLKSPGPNVIGMSYEDFSFNFTSGKNWEQVCD